MSGNYSYPYSDFVWCARCLYVLSTALTKRLRGIHAAWHFWYAANFGGESGLREVGLCGIHPLTRR
ncbi:TPA: DUF3265 domain-containing protein [Vibrio vulnificus]|nr:DUF3265 domain-containing protein [Vibrio vulnificus]ELV8592334.1 DUF3265 domain-containing protein [Vibrio vulnificus]HAS6231202.1 DUF3265 domain-containing protein [Vibrio vulnificus]HAS6304721.1 DUF3265 domain-containing protein [Vibrio vulnificus]HAS8547565.1 DUF3265 domain-containing protein [Vibrio vulnificus]